MSLPLIVKGVLFGCCFAASLFCLCLSVAQFFSRISCKFVAFSLDVTDMSSAKSRSSNVSVKVHLMLLVSHGGVSFMTQSIPRHKRKGDSMHPYFNPVLISKSSVKYWPHMTLVLKSPQSSLIMLTILGGFHSAGIYARESLCESRKPTKFA